MSNTTRLIAGWLLAAAIAVAFSWGAVAQVRNRVIQPSVVIPTTQLAAQLEATSTTTAAPRVVRVEPETDGTTTSTIGATPTTPNTTNPPQQTAPSTTTTTVPTSTTTSTTLPAATTTTVPPTTTSTTTTTAPPVTQTASYSLVGGVVTISYSPGVVNFVSAIPQPGFSTDTRETGPDEVRIRFEGDEHTSDFRARWQAGELEITQSETGGDD